MENTKESENIRPKKESGSQANVKSFLHVNSRKIASLTVYKMERDKMEIDRKIYVYKACKFGKQILKNSLLLLTGYISLYGYHIYCRSKKRE